MILQNFTESFVFNYSDRFTFSKPAYITLVDKNLMLKRFTAGNLGKINFLVSNLVL